MFVAGGKGRGFLAAIDPSVSSIVMTSPSGTAWTARATPLDSLLWAPVIQTLAAHNGRVVAAGLFASGATRTPAALLTRVALSTDGGVTFTPIPSWFDGPHGYYREVEVTSVATDGAGTWMVSGHAWDNTHTALVTLMVSTDDGVSWSNCTTPVTGVAFGLISRVRWCGDRWMIHTQVSTTFETYFSLNNGASWFAIFLPGPVMSQTDWIAASGATQVIDTHYSTDSGATWTVRTLANFRDPGGGTVTGTSAVILANGLYTGSHWVTYANLGSGKVDFFTSPDGVTWTAVGYGWGSTSFGASLEFGTGVTLIGRLGGTPDHALVSTDGGVSWAPTGPWHTSGSYYIPNITLGQLVSGGPLPLDVFFDTGADNLYSAWSVLAPLVAPGNGAGVSVSTDLGATWSDHAAVAPLYTWSAAEGRVNAVAWNGSYYLAVGTDGSGYATVISSPDGITWTLVASPLDAQHVQGAAVHWNGSLWMVGYEIFAGSLHPNLMTSPDGTTWTTHDVTSLGAVVAIGWTGGVWDVSDASTEFAHSSNDGATWTAIASQIAHAFVKTP